MSLLSNRAHHKLHPLPWLLALPLGLAGGCHQGQSGAASSPAGAPPTTYASSGTTTSARRTTTQSANGAYNMNAPIMPDPKLTPGAALAVTKADFCVSGYSKLVRNVPQNVKEAVYKEYGITHREKGEYEVDHLISLELGGSNDIKNLWPQSFKTKPWNAHVKDVLENKLHDMICAGQIDEKTAQQAIATNWIAAYKQYVGPEPRESEGGKRGRARAADSAGTADDSGAAASGAGTSGAANPAAGGGDGKVWVNTKSGKYFRPGEEYYGKTKQGQYMSESQALAQGYKHAGGH